MDSNKDKRYTIAFIDTEVEPKSGNMLDYGAIRLNNSTFHKASLSEFVQFIQRTNFICGHNIIHHDLKYLGKALNKPQLDYSHAVDTLYLSPLLFPTHPYHNLVKDDKLLTDELSNPLNDAIKARDLFFDEIAAFRALDFELQNIFHGLLKDQTEFAAFFRYLSFTSDGMSIKTLIEKRFDKEFCENTQLEKLIEEEPVALAYALSLINSYVQHHQVRSITPPWVLKRYPKVERIMYILRSHPCITGCAYCDKSLDAVKGLKDFFGFDAYRKFDGEPLQENAVKAALNGKSIIAVFPTGGGKSITFQIPALMQGAATGALTVVISPLQSLMKDQVDNLEKHGITNAVTINGLLDPVERAKSFERAEDGSASILYISPESLRSKSIERLILNRKIARFVIDEAHCFSSWGQDFRVDYLYIGDFIKRVQTLKRLDDSIPVSCFTATAKLKVVEDIITYFKDKLQLELNLFSSKTGRTNLHYQVIFKKTEEEKYQAARDLIEEKDCPTIVYVSRTRRAYDLAKRLEEDGYSARPYHGKMEVKEKTANQDAFIAGEIPIIVATSAFGMGVDKDDVGMVIHYDISDSLENYVQEAGRAGRSANIEAECYVLYNEEDLNKHFILLNQTKLTIKEIQQVWKAIKDISKYRSKFSRSALEIARKAGWDEDVFDIETRVTTAIAALEDVGYLKRGQNMPKIFANSILVKSFKEAETKIRNSYRFSEKQKEQAKRIVKKLLSSKSRKQNNDDDDGESRVDYISDHLGIVKSEVISIINILREENILADTKDLTAYINRGSSKNKSLNIFNTFIKVENFLQPFIHQEERVLHLKELNEKAENNGITELNVNRLRTIFNFWSIKNWIKRKYLESKNLLAVQSLEESKIFKEKIEKRHILAQFIIEYLYDKNDGEFKENDIGVDEILVEFSVHELKDAYLNSNSLFKLSINIDDIEDTLFYLSRIHALKIEGGFLVIYNQLTIERKENNNRKLYTKDDYQKLHQFYLSRIQQIHIVGEYAKKMVNDYHAALQFVDDYFQLNYSSFLQKYFNGDRQKEIKRNITPTKFRQLFGELSPTQLKIITDNDSPNIAVLAGPGSGKTRILVHKLASLLLMEDIKHEQLLMLTFSRSAATEFKKRLIQLIGGAANFVEIKTFHSYCFDLLGRVGNLEKSQDVIPTAIEKIENYEVEVSQITKLVLVLDEAQDMDANEFKLIQTLMKHNEEMKVIAVGDDDQNIFEFRHSNSKYLEDFALAENTTKYELLENYRSKQNIVDFSNQFGRNIKHRLKNTPIFAKQNDNGKIKTVQYQSQHLITPIVNDIVNTDLAGSTCVLTRTNEEALQITGLLIKNGVRAKLIQSNDGFNLYNLKEVRAFIYLLNLNEDTYFIKDEQWEHAKRIIKAQFEGSEKLEILDNIIQQFEISNPYRKFKTDFAVFVRESMLEDFYATDNETIFVSTMHKAKGKEFANIFILLDNYQYEKDEDLRLLYVAMTRAKNNLTIHTNSHFLDNITAENTFRINDDNIYQPTKELALQLNHKNVHLGYFKNKQGNIARMKSGDKLDIDYPVGLSQNGETVLRFSKEYQTDLNNLYTKGYQLKSAKVNFIVYWKSENEDFEFMIILPELHFERVDTAPQ